MRRLTIVVAAAALLCGVPFSFDWSQEKGVSLSLDSAQAVVGRPLTPGSVAGVARRTARRNAFVATPGAACHFVIVNGVRVRRCI
jgi:hypothetical protein